jgi:hypothetical protein
VAIPSAFALNSRSRLEVGRSQFLGGAPPAEDDGKSNRYNHLNALKLPVMLDKPFTGPNLITALSQVLTSPPSAPESRRAAT